MNKYHALTTWSIIALMALAASGCTLSTANISEAYMARDPEGDNKTTVFSSEDTFYCIVELSNAPDDTVVRALWTAVNVVGETPNTEIGEASITSTDGQHTFDLNNEGPWPVGQYKVDLFLNDEQEPEATLEFSVRR